MPRKKRLALVANEEVARLGRIRFTVQIADFETWVRLLGRRVLKWCVGTSFVLRAGRPGCLAFLGT